MDIKKIIPWNWFKKEDETAGVEMPVQHTENIHPKRKLSGPFELLQQEMDDMFDSVFRGFVDSPFSRGNRLTTSLKEFLIKPDLDIGANDKEYTINIEVPGVSRKDIHMEISGNTLTISGEKKNEVEEKEKDYYRVERSFGSFQRVLSLPGDADHDKIKAKVKNGVLTISIQRTGRFTSDVKQIEIH